MDGLWTVRRRQYAGKVWGPLLIYIYIIYIFIHRKRYWIWRGVWGWGNAPPRIFSFLGFEKRILVHSPALQVNIQKVKISKITKKFALTLYLSRWAYLSRDKFS